MEEEFDLLKYWEMIKKHWLMIAAISLIAALISGLVSFFMIKPVFQASTTLIVGKKASDSPVQQAGQLLDYNVLLANQQLAKTYGAIAKSRTVEENVIEELDLPLAAEMLDRKISVVPVKDTEILAIKVEDTNPVMAAQITNTMANQFSKAVIDIKKVDSVSIVDVAIAPKNPVKPKKILNIFIAFIIGLMGAVGLALFLEHLDKTIKTTRDAENILGFPALGMIPQYELDDPTIQSPKSSAAEAFRTLRTNIQFSNVDGAVKRILFTSTGPREGKSSIIANLASMIAKGGKNVLIIDADLRNPSQHKLFGRANFEGLTTALVDEALLISTYIKKTEQEGLELLMSGPIPPNPAELLGSKRMRQFLNEAAVAYDFVLIDSPPTIAVTDSSILAQAVDGVIFVLASGQVSRDFALQAKEQLEKVGAKIIGLVVNKMEMKTKESYYYYSYEK